LVTTVYVLKLVAAQPVGHYLFTQGLSAYRLNLFLDKERCDHNSLELLKETAK